ncbi:metallopeptidase family protein [Streptantibioticus ferralitis]|uniref:Metallopeptidase family protein n=1 Tax=Streptantibioticus ferralitis TaxID=236510 RepID=A0ABT5ZBJ4_9ACTN|nr:metallopeptidase family protein [Streptantibioticus ferralitis]MDF2260400.1 metallopeptidase family protein [Streptantibioticus ferralitis]
MDTPVPPPSQGAAAAPATGPLPRRRDRHGRGMRGPIAPPQVPLSVSRSDAFDDLVRDAAERLERRWPQLAEVEFAVQDVPPTNADTPDDDVVPLGRLISAGASGKGPRNRIVVYRRPVEIRAKGRDERALLVHEVVVEQVAELLGLSPENVDPRYGEE